MLGVGKKPVDSNALLINVLMCYQKKRKIYKIACCISNSEHKLYFLLYYTWHGNWDLRIR